jgi:hypothetical protein
MSINPIQLDTGTLLAALALAALLLAWGQWRRANDLKQAAFAHRLLQKFYHDQDIRSVARCVDSDSVWHNATFYTGSPLKPIVDAALEKLSYVCYLRQAGYIRKADFAYFQYLIDFLADDLSVQEYLFNLYHIAQQKKMAMPYYHLFRYIRGRLPQEFFRMSNRRYTMVVNV